MSPGEAAGRAFTSSNPSFKCSLHLTALQSWVSPQRGVEQARGMLVTKANRRGQVTMSCCRFLAGIHGSCSLLGGQLAVSPALWWWQVMFCMVSAALEGVRLQSQWKSCRGGIQGKANPFPRPSGPFASLCPFVLREMLWLGHQAISFGLHLLLLLSSLQRGC